MSSQRLSVIFEQFWESGEVPHDWKLGNYVQISKKSKKKNPGNHRLFSLTSVPSKIMEKIILPDTEKDLEENRVTGHSQHGFTRGNPAC